MNVQKMNEQEIKKHEPMKTEALKKTKKKQEKKKKTLKTKAKKGHSNKIGIGLVFLSFVFLIPGLIAPLVTMSGSMKIVFVRKTLFESTRSIIQTITNLVDSGNFFVAGLILFFSVLVPLLKGILLLTVFLSKKHEKKQRKVYKFIRGISKWAMADVFVAGIFVAFLAARATKNMDAVIEPGFYFFTTYCILSLISLHFLKPKQQVGQSNYDVVSYA